MGPAGAANIIFRGDPDVATKTDKYVEDFATHIKRQNIGFVDQIIEPKETRFRIIQALKMLETKVKLDQLKNMGIYRYKQK